MLFVTEHDVPAPEIHPFKTVIPFTIKFVFPDTVPVLFPPDITSVILFVLQPFD